jgi:hypothetical protein
VSGHPGHVCRDIGDRGRGTWQPAACAASNLAETHPTEATTWHSS